MNIKQLEAQARALAPVIKNTVDKAVGALKAELQSWVKTGLEGLETALNQRIDEVKQAIPAPDQRDLLDQEGAKLLFSQMAAEEFASIRKDHEAAQQALDEAFNAAIDGNAKEVSARLEELSAAIKQQTERQFITQEEAQTLVSEQINTIKTDLAASAPVTSGEPGDEDAAMQSLMERFEQQLNEFDQRFAEAWVKYIEEMETPIEWPKLIDQESLKTAVAGWVKDNIATIEPPKNGEPGKNGAPGADGKDATQLEILPALDFAKSYPRGTHAIHNGGLMRAYQQTVGEKGWETLLNGVADVQIEQKDARNFVIRTLQTNGKAAETGFTVPVMVYRNVYKEGAAYDKGDVVTWAGSLWHADKDQPPGKPGTADSGWTMAAKKGRDGKNGGDQ